MTTPVPQTKSRSELLVFERTDVGRVRDHNEDSKYSDPEGQYFVVADGMGGHAAGEVASHLAVEEVKRVLGLERAVLDALGSKPNPRNRPIMMELLTRVGSSANQAVRKRASEDKATHGMGTTLEVVCVTGDGAWIAHVGDSRTYLVRDRSVVQLTTDHTVAQRLMQGSREHRPEVLEQWGSVLVEAIGAKDEVNVEVVHSTLEVGDRLLLCSDGLYEYFPRAEEIGEVLAMEGSKAGLERLVDLAFERGGKDNITGVLVEVVSAPKARKKPRSEEIAYDTTVDGMQAVQGESEQDYPEQDYGIEEAIALMRKLPAENVELVVQVVARTLRSTQIAIAPIVRDARSKEARLERRVTALKGEIASLEHEISRCAEEIARQETDREETTMVMDRLKLAQSLDS